LPDNGIGNPFPFFSQMTVVSRWLVIPTAARWSAEIPRFSAPVPRLQRS
jgi:hypothetical protein